MDKIWIGKRCTIIAEGLNPEVKLYYTALVLDIDDNNLITIKDKFNEIVTFNTSRIIQISEIQFNIREEDKNGE
jgi:hypothetical protein